MKYLTTSFVNLKAAMAKYDDHGMTWYGHGDSYSPWYDHSKVMAWSSWDVA